MLMDTSAVNKTLTGVLLFASLAFSTSTYAAEKLFDLAMTARQATDSGVAVAQIAFTSNSGDEVEIGELFDIAMPTGEMVTGEVTMHSGAAPVQGAGESFLPLSADSKVLQLVESNGSLELHLFGSTIAGITLHDTENGKIYRARLDGNGTGMLMELDPNSLVCTDFTPPVSDVEEISAERLATIQEGLTTEVVRNLESRTGATNTIYIDYWGGTLDNTVWNGGRRINYEPYSFDNNFSSFSATDLGYMWLAWAEMAEDYGSFDVNITTSEAVFKATPIANRSRVIATPTCEWYELDCKTSGLGGVAQLNVFNSTNEFRKTAWSFNKYPQFMGVVHSHEAGHQMGLVHDGIGAFPYYGGFGNWGPIMGNPVNKQYVQWSKGEYPNANQQQDDLAILVSVLGLRADDAGDSKSSANELVSTTGTNYSITEDGIEPDIDVFAFTLASAREVSINVSSILGVGGENRAANVALNVTLENSAGTVVSSITSADKTPLQPNTNTFSFSDSLAAGTYYLTIDAVSPYPNWQAGFGEYGNGGEYQLVADLGRDPAPSPVADPSMTTPAPGSTLSGFTDTFNWVSNGTEVLEYWMYAGSEPGLFDYDNSGPLSASTLNYTTTALPIDGSSVYVTLFWRDANRVWQNVQYTYTAVSGDGPSFTAPASGTLAGFSDTISWSGNDSGATEFWLYLGSVAGGADYYNSGPLGNSTSSKVGFLPTDGSTVYGRLWYRVTPSARWRYLDDTFVAATSGGPTITSPEPGTAIAASPVTLTWEAGQAEVTEWWLYVGSEAGGRDIYDSGSLGTALSASVPMPANGTKVSVTLWFKVNNKWRSTNFEYVSNPNT